MDKPAQKPTNISSPSDGRSIGLAGLFFKAAATIEGAELNIPPPGLRLSGNEGVACGTCAHYDAGGKCRAFDVVIGPDQVCDAHKPIVAYL